MDAAQNTQDPLSKLTQLGEITQKCADEQTLAKCTWRGRSVIVGDKDFSEISLWRQLKQCTDTCMPNENICVQIGLCQRNLNQVREKTEAAYSKASFIDRAIDTLYRVFFGPPAPQTTTHEFLFKIEDYEERLKMQKTIEFIERYGNKYEPLRKLLIEESSSKPPEKSKKSEIAEELAKEIIKADIRDIPYLIKSANAIIEGSHWSDTLGLGSHVEKLFKEEDFKKGVLEAAGSARVLFESSMNNTLQDLDKETLRSLTTGNGAKQLNKLFFLLEDYASIFPHIKNMTISFFVRKIRETLGSFYSIPDVTQEEKQRYFPNQMDQDLFDALLDESRIDLYQDKTPRESDKLWFQTCSIVKTLAAQKENISAQKAAITILNTRKPPQSKQSRLIDNIRNYSSYYAGFDKKFLKKTVICFLIKENASSSPEGVLQATNAYLLGHADPRGKDERKARRCLNVFSLFGSLFASD